MGTAVEDRRGQARQGSARLGRAVEEWQGEAWSGLDRHCGARRGSRGVARLGLAGLGSLGMACTCADWYVTFLQGSHGMVQGSLGCARLCAVWHGVDDESAP